MDKEIIIIDTVGMYVTRNGMIIRIDTIDGNDCYGFGDFGYKFIWMPTGRIMSTEECKFDIVKKLSIG